MLLYFRRRLPELEHKEKAPSSFPLKMEYLMSPRIKSGVKACTVTIEVPAKVKNWKKLGKEIFREKINIGYLSCLIYFDSLII